MATPRMTARLPSVLNEVTRPVTYMAFVVNSPLPGPLSAAGAKAKHSNEPPDESAWKDTSVVTGAGFAPPVPPSMMV
ncbi:MAG: hypothetical protein ACRDV2_13510 [Actinomycetes bacterium]